MHLARSEIDTPLKVFSTFGVLSGVLLFCSLAALSLRYGPLDYSSVIFSSSGYSSAFTFSSLLVASMIDGLFVICGGLVVLSTHMNIERRRVLAFFVFIASVLGMFASLLFLGLVFLGPQ
jgi:hypothetical protein